MQTPELPPAIRALQEIADAHIPDMPGAWNDEAGWNARQFRNLQLIARTALAAQTAELEALRKDAERWQPIETAPDELNFHAIVASPLDHGGFYVEEAWWDHERREWWPANVNYGDAYGDAIYPTHWMPLPAPPDAAITASTPSGSDQEGR